MSRKPRDNGDIRESPRETTPGLRTKATWMQAVEYTAMGIYTEAKIAEMAGVSRNTLWEWKKKPEFMEDVWGKHRVIFSNLVPKALKTLEESLDSANGKVRLDAARLILDRTIYAEISGNQRPAGSDQPVQVNIQVNYE